MARIKLRYVNEFIDRHGSDTTFAALEAAV